MLLGVGALYWLFSLDAERCAPAMGLIAACPLLNVILNLSWWSVGHDAWQSAVFNVVVNALLAGWMWTVRPRTRAGLGESTPV